MLKFNVKKDVKNDVIELKDISLSACYTYLPLTDIDRGIGIGTLENLRNSFWYMDTISILGIFEDAASNSGLVTVTKSSITFYYPENKNQILQWKNGLTSIEFKNLQSKMFIDSDLINKYSPKLDFFYMKNVAYIADNGVIFKDNDKFYGLIF